MDKYLGFSYRGIRLGMDNNPDFKGFIVNDGEGLQFVNSPEFSNEFAQMPYGKQTFYLGNTQGNRMFTLEIALKEVNLQEYRNFLMWLGLDTKGVLSFDYNSKYGYDVKVDSIENGVFQVIEGCGEEEETEYNVELAVSFVTTGRAEARWVFTEPVWKGIGHADNISVDNDKVSPNNTWIENPTTNNFTFYNRHNVNNAIKIEFTDTIEFLGVTLHGTAGTNTYFSEYGIIIGSDGTFGYATTGTGENIQKVEIPKLIIKPEKFEMETLSGDWISIKPTSYEII